MCNFHYCSLNLSIHQNSTQEPTWNFFNFTYIPEGVSFLPEFYRDGTKIRAPYMFSKSMSDGENKKESLLSRAEDYIIDKIEFIGNENSHFTSYEKLKITFFQ